ncbi:hypothetical protein BKA56DRAFT_584098 [Ilyonectria sp. MPI-CAGE-AT-0026]|nr:hypothetical protein BKA56DRAFT_584098 [Ilyonectria sp. MPI-CAGE-AT-0026]
MVGAGRCCCRPPTTGMSLSCGCCSYIVLNFLNCVPTHHLLVCLRYICFICDKMNGICFICLL